MKNISLIFLFVFFSSSVFAAPVIVYKFDSKEHEEIFYRLSDELRCLVCQNQNIAESNSELALDLRRQVYEMLQEGHSEEAIVDFMVERYGDYVLFNPQFKPLTWLLWLGPLVIFIASLIYAIRIVASKRKEVVDENLSAEELERLKQLKSEINTKEG